MRYCLQSERGHEVSEDLGDLTYRALDYANDIGPVAIRDTNGKNVLTAWRITAGVVWRAWPNHPGEYATIRGAWDDWCESNPGDAAKGVY